MGYILPVTPYSYSNYQKRVMKKRNSSYQINRKPSITFQRIDPAVESETNALRKLYLDEQSDEKHDKIRKLSGQDFRHIPVNNGGAKYGKGQQVNIQI